MKKYDLLRSGDNIVRVLDFQDDRILMIDCVKHTMPVWMETELLESYSECSNEELYEITGLTKVDMDALDADQRKVMHERYTMIAPIVSFISDDKMRSKLISSIVEEHRVSKQTVRNYLCLYLSYLDVTILAPKKRKDERELTQDEKHMRWALNKFFYTTKKQSLIQAEAVKGEPHQPEVPLRGQYREALPGADCFHEGTPCRVSCRHSDLRTE